MNNNARRLGNKDFSSRLATLFAFAAAFIGLLGLIGWFFGISALKSALPQFPAMKFNAALCITLLSLSLLTPPKNRLFTASRSWLVPIVVFAVVGATITEYLFGVDLGIDQLLFTDSPDLRFRLLPGRMSLVAALILLMSSASIIVRNYISRAERLWQSLVCCNLFLAGFAFLGAIYDFNILAKIAPYTSIALPTSLALILLNLSLLFSRPDLGIMREFNSDLSGGRSARKLLPVTIVILATLGGLTRIGHKEDLFDPSFDAIFIVMFGSALLVWQFWRSAGRLNSIDAKSREISEHLQLLIDHSPGAAALLDKNMRYLWASQRWIQDFRLEGQDLIGRSHYEIFPEIPDHWREIHRRCLAGATEKNDQETFHRADGSIEWIRWEIRPWIKANHEIGGIALFSEDISEKARAEEARKKADAQLHEQFQRINLELEQKVKERTKEIELHSTIVKNMAEGVCLVHAQDGRIIYANPRFAEMFGYQPGELDGKPVEVMNFDDGSGLAAETAREIMGQIMKDGVHTYEVQNVRKDGTPFWCRATASVFSHPVHGELLVTVQEDISDRKKMNAKLAASERKFRAMIEGAYDSILTVDANGRIVLVNDQLATSFGYGVEELIGQQMEILLPERYRSDYVKSRRAYVRNPHPRSMGVGFSLFARRKNGSEFPVDISLSPISTPEGVQVTAFIRDITERKRVEDQQTFLSEMTQILNEPPGLEERIQNIAHAIVPKIADNCVVRILEGNELHFKAAAFCDKSIADKIIPLLSRGAGLGGPFGARTAIETGKPVFVEDMKLELPAYTKELPDISNIAHLLRTTSYVVLPLTCFGRKVGTLQLFMSESGRKLTSDDLVFLEVVASRCASAVANAMLYSEVQSAVAARETVLSIVSHDLKNPLAAIDMSAQLLLRENSSREHVVAIAVRMQNSISMMQRLIGDLLDFGKINAGTLTLEKEPILPPDIVHSALEAIEEHAKAKKILLGVDISPNCPPVLADKGRVVQVLWNLLGNAVKFTPEHGAISLKVESEKEQVRFEVMDTGPGIDPENLPKVFDRFWQAKKTASLGTGLGLAIAKGVVEAHGGRIWAESNVGLGCKFSFVLPVAKRTVSAKKKSNIVELESKRTLEGLHVLVVDDSEDNLRLVRVFLERAGAHVSEARSGIEALTCLSKQRPDVMITDIEMPNEDGYHLIQKIHELAQRDHFDLPVAALTGHSDPKELRKMSEAGFDALLAKPITMEKLVASVEDLAGGRTLHYSARHE